MISFIVCRCIFYKRRYDEIIMLLHYETNYSFQRRKVF